MGCSSEVNSYFGVANFVGRRPEGKREGKKHNGKRRMHKEREIVYRGWGEGSRREEERRS